MTESEQTASLSVVLVNYRSGSMLLDRVSALSKTDKIQVIVVDNFSDDGSIEAAQVNAPSATYILNRENLGFSRAVNIGAAYATAPHLCLLNPDAEISVESLLNISKILDEDTSIGVLAPNIQHADGVRVMEAGWEPTVRHVFTHATGLSMLSGRWHALRGFHARADPDDTELMEVDWVSGALLLTRTSVWRELDGLDERWFMYTEDLEYCHRVRALGYQVVVAAQVPAWHAVGSSVSEGSLGQRPMTRSRRPTDTMWITTLFEYFRDELASSRPSVVAWIFVMASGIASRMVLFQIRSLLVSDARRRSDAKFMASKFRWSLCALLSHSLKDGTR